MGRDDDRAAPVGQIPQRPPDAGGQVVVEARGRFVQQQDLRLHLQGPQDAHPASLPAGELVDLGVVEFVDPQISPDLREPRSGSAGVGTDLQVLVHREPGKQVTRLVDDADRVTSEAGPAVLVQLAEVLSRHFDDALIRRGQTSQDVQQGGFPTAGRRYERHQFAGVDPEIEIFEHDVFAIRLRDAVTRDSGRHLIPQTELR